MPRVLCNHCKIPLPLEQFNAPDLFACPSCRSLTEVLVFPALLREQERGQAGETLLVGSEASCFYHPLKKAVIPCSRCGRFLCALCDVELAGEHLCPVCLERGKEKGQLTTVENKRTLYDNIALALVLYPLLFCAFITPVTAVAALVIAIRYWSAPGSLVPRGKSRFIWAIVIAVLQLLWWIGMIIMLVTDNT